MVRWTLGQVLDGSGTLLKVKDPWGGPEPIGGHSGRCGLCLWTLGIVRNGSRDPR